MSAEPVDVRKFYFQHADAGAYAAKLLAHLGAGHEYEAEWKNVGGFLELEVKDASVPYDIPMPHRVYTHGSIGLRLSGEALGAISSVTGAFLYDGITGILTARCQTITGCAVLLGWAEAVWFGNAPATRAELTRRLLEPETPSWFPESLKRIDHPQGYAVAKGEDYDVTLEIPIAKADEEKRQVTGIVLEPGVFDAQDEIVSEEEIEKAAHSFLSRYNMGSEMGVMHQMFGKLGISLVESWVTKADQEIGGEPVRKGSWVMTVKVENDNLWRSIKSGGITGFSIGGVAKARTPTIQPR